MDTVNNQLVSLKRYALWASFALIVLSFFAGMALGHKSAKRGNIDPLALNDSEPATERVFNGKPYLVRVQFGLCGVAPVDVVAQ